jgi:hypothetical protein
VASDYPILLFALQHEDNSPHLGVPCSSFMTIKAEHICSEKWLSRPDRVYRLPIDKKRIRRSREVKKEIQGGDLKRTEGIDYIIIGPDEFEYPASSSGRSGSDFSSLSGASLGAFSFCRAIAAAVAARSSLRSSREA